MTEIVSALRKIPAPSDDGSSVSSGVSVLPGGLGLTTQVPFLPDGTMDVGTFESQTRRTLDNLREALEGVGASLDDVAHLTIYLTDMEDRHEFNAIYREYFSRPYPVRAAIGIAALAVEGMRVEVTAHVAVPS